MKPEDWPAHVRDLVPPGFDPDNYKSAERLDSVGWYRELFPRMLVSLGVDSFAGFCLLSKGRDRRGYRMDFPLPSGTVQTVLMKDLEPVVANVPTPIHEVLRMFERRYHDEDPISQFLYGPSDTEYCSVDLAADTEMTVTHFRSWLYTVRRLRGVRPREGFVGGHAVGKWTPKRLRSLADNQVLAYLDLEHWHKAEDQPLPKQAALKALLFPREDPPRSDSMFSKLTARVARSLMSTDALQMLGSGCEPFV